MIEDIALKLIAFVPDGFRGADNSELRRTIGRYLRVAQALTFRTFDKKIKERLPREDDLVRQGE